MGGKDKKNYLPASFFTFENSKFEYEIAIP